jgi:hypothetical protein
MQINDPLATIPLKFQDRSDEFKNGLARGGKDAWEGNDPAFDLDACEAPDATEEMQSYLAGWNEV